MKKASEIIPGIWKNMKKKWKVLYVGLDENFEELNNRLKILEDKLDN